MLASAVLLAALSSLALAPSVSAAAFSDVVPVYDADDGVRVVKRGERLQLQFAPKAARIYRSIAGRRAIIGCAKLSPAGPGRFSPDEGFGWPTHVPRRRTTLETGVSEPGYDVCTVAVRSRRGGCVPPDGPDADDQCLRVIVPMSLEGRLHLARVLRIYDLVLAYEMTGIAGQDPTARGGADVDWRPHAQLPRAVRRLLAPLATPDAVPPAGRVGYWTDGRQFAFSVLDLAGKRLYFSGTGTDDDPVISTNVPELVGPDLPTIAL